MEPIDIDTTPLLDNNRNHGINKSNESLDSDFSSLKRTKKQLRFFDNLNFLEDEDSSTEEAKEAIENGKTCFRRPTFCLAFVRFERR